MNNLNKNSDNLEIIRYLQGKQSEISPTMIEKLQRLHVCADLIKKHGSRLTVIPKMVKLYGYAGNYSAQTAQRDFDDTQEIFGATPHSSRDFWFDVILGLMMETRQKCLIKHDLKTAASIEQRMMKAIHEFIGDKELYPVDLIQPQAVELGFFPELMKVKLPENLEEQLQKLMENKRKKNLMIDDAQLADEAS